VKAPRKFIVTRWRKNRQKWELDIMLPPGSTPSRIKRLFDAEAAAIAEGEQWRSKVEAAWREAQPVKDQALTLAAAFERYFEAKARKKSLDEDRRIAKHLVEHFGADTRLRDITAARISTYKGKRLAAVSVRRKDDDGKPAKLSAASINRPLALLRTLLNLACEEWGVLPQVPVVKLEREPEGRIVWLEPHEEAPLLDACAASSNPDLKDLVTVALETGLRKGELVGLVWERVDAARGVLKLEKTKGGKRREVPMRQVVHNILAQRRPEDASGRVWPGVDYRSAFETAVKKAGLDSMDRFEGEPFTFHGCRHHFASTFMMAGGDLLSLQKILGHGSLKMTERYAHLSPDHLRAAMERTERPTDSRGARFGARIRSQRASEASGDVEVIEVTGAGGGS